MKKLKILDCTLRDGGYINNWNFGEKNIHKIIEGLMVSKIDIIEYGYLDDRENYDDHSTRFTSVADIDKLIKKQGDDIQNVCMIDYGTYKIEHVPEKNQTSIDGIRIVFHKKQIDEALDFAEKLMLKGYQVFIQPMVTISYSDQEILNLATKVNKIKPYAFYIVDSFGMMKAKDLIRLFYVLDNNLNEEIAIGYHAHNNLQLAYSNAQSMLEINSDRACIIDVSIMGMGRGAGNLNTELFLNKFVNGEYNIDPILQIIDSVINKIYLNNYWGYSLPHYLSAVSGCHPSYATYLSEKNSLTVEGISYILENLSDEYKINYNQDYIENQYLLYQRQVDCFDDEVEELKEYLKGKTVLLLAPGKTLNTYKDHIKRFIEEKSSICCICINFYEEDYDCDYIFMSNNKRFAEAEAFNKLKSNRLIATSNLSLTDEIKEKSLIVNYSSLIDKNLKFPDNSSFMLLKLLIQCDVSEVFIAGMDGYSYNHNENYSNPDLLLDIGHKNIKTMNDNMIHGLNYLRKEIGITLITPSKYEVV